MMGILVKHFTLRTPHLRRRVLGGWRMVTVGLSTPPRRPRMESSPSVSWTVEHISHGSCQQGMEIMDSVSHHIVYMYIMPLLSIIHH